MKYIQFSHSGVHEKLYRRPEKEKSVEATLVGLLGEKEQPKFHANVDIKY